MSPLDKSRALGIIEHLAQLDAQCRPEQSWRVELEPHSYRDGTTHFTHVVSDGMDGGGHPVKVSIASHLTPELADLLMLSRNNLAELVAWARLGVEGSGQGQAPPAGLPD